MQWDIFCRVIDNFGDVGVCWRLAADLSARGEQVRLTIDDPRALAWMAPRPSDGGRRVQVRTWLEADIEARGHGPIGDVVIEAFGCDLSDPVLACMAERQARGQPCVWINLEYLSAEDDVERSHQLTSPRFHGPAAGLTKWFFYPGFTTGTGGLLREPSLLSDRDQHDGEAWLAGMGASRQPDETVVSLFCYDAAALSALLDRLQAPVLLLVTAGLADAVASLAERPGLRIHHLPWLTQADFDRLLWSCDLNLVRGEDSFVRAQWAARPFVWQIYPQSDDVHLVKLDAFLDKFLAGAPLEIVGPVRSSWMLWNGFEHLGHGDPLPLIPWRQWCEDWRRRLSAQTDLASQLVDFASRKTLK